MSNTKIVLQKIKFTMPPAFLLVFLFALWVGTSVAGAEILPSETIEGVYLGKTVIFEDAPFYRVVVGDADIASVRSVSKTMLIIKGIKPGLTNLTLWYEGAEAPGVYEFRVGIDPAVVARAEKYVKELVPDARVKIIPIDAQILLEGEVDSLVDMQRVIQVVTPFFSLPNGMAEAPDDDGKTSNVINIAPSGDAGGGSDTEGQMEKNVNTVLAIKNNLVLIKGPQQVQLEAKIAEVSRSGIKKMGLSFVNNKDWTIGVFPTGDASGKALTSQSAATLASTVGVASTFGAAFQVLLHSTHDDMLSILSLLKGQGLSRILATPTLVAMSGQEASFTVGGEFPVPTAGDNGGTNIEYKKYGTLLRFRPVVIGKETISLKLKAEVSSPDYSLGTMSGGVAVPGLKTRIASSTLELKDGQSFAMAGLLKENSYSVVSKIPLLGDLPLVGALFTSKEFEKDETELVIIVTPRLVQPLDPGDVKALPGDMVRDCISDLDFFIRNRVEEPAGPRKVPMPEEMPQITGKMGFER